MATRLPDESGIGMPGEWTHGAVLLKGALPGETGVSEIGVWSRGGR